MATETNTGSAPGAGKPLRVAVVGVGRMGRQHARILAGMPEAELAAVVDTKAEKLTQCAEQYGARAENNFTNLDDVDAVVVATPTRLHCPVARFFLERGVSVLVEKPMAGTLAEADAMIEAAARGGARLQVGHVERFNPAVMALHKHISHPLFIVSERISPFSFRSMDIGVVLDLMIHDIDIILHMAPSQIKNIDAAGFGIMTDTEDVANARITFDDGCIADVTASRLSDKTVRKIRVFSREAYLSMDYVSRKALLYRPTERLLAPDFDPGKIDLSGVKELKDAVFPSLVSITEVPMDEHDPLTMQAASFLQSVRNGSEPVVPGSHGRRALAAAITISERIISRSWSGSDQ